MKRVFPILFFLSFSIQLYAINTDIYRDSLISNKPKLNSAYFLRPYDMYQNANQQLFGLSFEGQTAFNNVFSLKVIEDICGNTDMFHVKLLIGPQYNVFENAIEGLLFGVYPGIVIDPINETDQVKWKIVLVGEVAFNILTFNHFGVGVYANTNILDIYDVSVGIKIGILFENPTYKVY